MKIATNLEQSEKLAKFVPLYTADMRLDEFNTPYPFPWKFYSGIGSAIIKPSWSLAVLVKMLPREIYYEPKGWEDEELDMKLDFGKKSDDENEWDVEGVKTVTQKDDDIRDELIVYLDWLDGHSKCAPKGKYTIRKMIDWVSRHRTVDYIDGKDNKRIKCVDEDVNDNDLMAILISQHISKAIIPAEELQLICCMAGNPNAEDLLKVVDVEGREYWCDEIEFTKV